MYVPIDKYQRAKEIYDNYLNQTLEDEENE